MTIKAKPTSPCSAECHRFCEKMGWTIVHEEQEDGVSGHKVRAENRDKLQIIKERAKQGKFDILLVFMFDRIGRIADETPFVVEWFVKNGIRVWSTQEGEQRFDTHTDKLTNYIRFWQADGESEKTSIRTKTALGQLVEDGGFKGGLAPYGYDLVKVAASTSESMRFMSWLSTRPRPLWCGLSLTSMCMRATEPSGSPPI